MTGWRAVHAPQASPKGLRHGSHGFGVAAVSAGIPLNLVQKWLGHAQVSTTAIYADATGAEEKDFWCLSVYTPILQPCRIPPVGT